MIDMSNYRTYELQTYRQLLNNIVISDSYRDITIELLDWDVFEKSILDTTYYQLETFQQYIFNTLILFSLDYYFV